MVDMLAIQGAVDSIKVIGNIAKAIAQLHNAAEIHVQASELLGAVIAAQHSTLAAYAEQSAMIQRVRDLEKEVADAKAWETEKQRYQLIAPLSGFYAYALKDTAKGTEIPHWICAHCYQEGRKEILQDVHVREGRKTLVKCPRCNFELDSLHRIEEIERKYV